MFPVIYINLDKRTDRNESILKQLRDHSYIASSVVRLSATPGGLSGCSTSHARALEYAWGNQYEEVLILEDDFEFGLDPETVKDRLSKLPKDWDFVTLTHAENRLADPTDVPGVMRLRRTSNAAAYLVRRRMFLILAQTIRTFIPMLEKTQAHWLYLNDVVWNRCFSDYNCYSFETPIGAQSDSASDLRGL